jgi:hypothetical protein
MTTYSNEDIDSAISAGVLTQADADAFRAHVERGRAQPSIDEEHFRLVTGFNDIFVVIACALLLLSVGWIGSAVAPLLGACSVALAAWGLAEFFVRKRRMALPAICLLLAFVGGSFYAGSLLLSEGKGATITGPLFAAVGAWFHWRRFQVPITIAAGVLPIVILVTTLGAGLLGGSEFALPIMLLAGIAVFVLAMHWDAKDRARQTRASDVAFWLHLSAAPLIVHPVFSAVNMLGEDADLLRALTVGILYLLIALVSLAIDRRALMVSSLAYVLYAFSKLLEDSGVVSLSFAITALIIGSALLMLSAFWHPSRTALLKVLPENMRLRAGGDA